MTNILMTIRHKLLVRVLREVLDVGYLGKIIMQCLHEPIKKKYDKPSNVVLIIEKQIEEWFGQSL